MNKYCKFACKNNNTNCDINLSKILDKATNYLLIV